jgi:hypothetical protein
VVPDQPGVSAPDASARAREWRENWKHAGEVLEAERWQRLAGLAQADRARMVLDLLTLWRPGVPGDDAEALVIVQRAFGRVQSRT